MATKPHGKDSVISIGGTTICTTGKGFTLTQDLAEATNDCDTQKEFLDGLKDHTMQAQGNQEVDTGATVNVLFAAYDSGGDTSWRIKTSDAVAGPANPWWDGTMRIRSLAFDFPVGGPATYNMQGQGTGPVTIDIAP